MNENDFIHKINEETKNLEIPESVSPEAMKAKLDSMNLSDRDNDRENKSGDYNKFIKRATVAACLLLAFAGTASVAIYTRLNSNLTTDKNAACEDTAVADDSAIIEESALDDAALGDTDEAQIDSDEDTGLVSPKNYSEYYKDIKKSYKKYYEEYYVINDEVNNLRGDKEEAIAEEAPAEDMGAGVTDNLQSFDSAATDEASAAEKQHSDTNRQEENVDEGDIVKTDGEYIYKAVTAWNKEYAVYDTNITITKADNGRLTHIADISIDAGQTDKKDNYDLYFSEFYIYKNSLVIMYSKHDYLNSKNETMIVIYDITDKKAPKKASVLTQSGTLITSRISDGYLYTISDYNSMRYDKEKPYENYIPCLNGSVIGCEKIHYPKDNPINSTKVITSLDLANTRDFADSAAVPGNYCNVYMSEKNIYLYERTYRTAEQTKISKLSYKNGKFTVRKGAVIAGYLYGPFAINEYKDHLRIVATIPANIVPLTRDFKQPAIVEDDSLIDEVPLNTEDVNVLYVLDDKMEITGEISGIAPGEVIYSARFMGDTGYFVTYKNTDPLFSVDLKDPENPKLMDALKIPGFSRYMHYYGNGKMLGIGEERDPKTQEFLGLKLSMFNLSNPYDITEEDKKILKDSDYSDALYNYKAIMIDPKKNIFGFAHLNYSNDAKMYYSTFAYDESYGFIETASYVVDLDTDYYMDYSQIRGLYIGDYFYLTTNDSITSYKIGSETIVDSIKLK